MSRLPFAADQPFAAKFFCNLLMRECLAGLNFGSTLSDSLNDVQTIKHILQAAIIRQSIQLGSFVFRMTLALRGRWTESTE